MRRARNNLGDLGIGPIILPAAAYPKPVRATRSMGDMTIEAGPVATDWRMWILYGGLGALVLMLLSGGGRRR